MDWVLALAHGQGIAGLILVLAAVIAGGLMLGSIAVRGIGIGVSGVLFAGLLYGHLAWRGAGEHPHLHSLEFLRDFGLVLFVYAIGMQLGPGFLGSMRSHGLAVNILAVVVVALGTAIAAIAAWSGLVPSAIAVGLLSGAVTNTPGLAAAQQAMIGQPAMVGGSDAAAISYAIAYPCGVIGVILCLALFRSLLPAAKTVAATASAGEEESATDLDLSVRNPGLVGQTLGKVMALAGGPVAVSRLMRGGTVVVANHDQVLAMGDVIHVVGHKADLERLRLIVGEVARVHLKDIGSLDVRRLRVTSPAAINRTIAELDLPGHCGATITRVSRAGIEFVAGPGIHLHYGDAVVVVGDASALHRAETALGNELQRLEHPLLTPIFVGIALGVFAGSIPIALPGLPAPVKLGLAGGPLLIALVLSWHGRLGPLNTYLPPAANLMLREIGIALFLACVGLKAGGSFADALASGSSQVWLALAVAITVVPIVLVGLFSRLVLGHDDAVLGGLLAGSMTDPPALAFAQAATGNDRPAVTYAAVYPLTMLLRVVAAQTFVLVSLGPGS